MAWHGGGHSQLLSHPSCPDPVSPLSPTSALSSAAAFSIALTFSLLHFQWPQELQVFRSQRHSVLITHFLWKAIVVCKPEILVSMLYSAALMRIKSIHEKYLLSMFIIYFSNITILDSGGFFPVPIYCPFYELSISITYSYNRYKLPNLYIPKVSLGPEWLNQLL